MTYRRASTPCVIYAINDQLVGLDRASGALRWERRLASTGIDLAFTVVDDAVFAAGNGPLVYRVNAVDGAVIWESDTGTRGLADITLVGSLLVLGRKGVVVALHAGTGDVAWTHQVERHPDRGPINVSGGTKR